MAYEHETTCPPFFKLIAVTAVLIFPFVVAYKDVARFYGGMVIRFWENRILEKK